MLILNAQTFVRAMRRPAKRRYQAINTDFQALEPRLFLSVDSLVATAVETDIDSEPTTAVESSIDAATVAAAIQATGIQTPTDPGTSSPTAWTTDPQFQNAGAAGGTCSGTVEWPENPSGVAGLWVAMTDLNGNWIGYTFTDANGYFEVSGMNGYPYITAVLYDNGFNVVDQVTLPNF